MPDRIDIFSQTERIRAIETRKIFKLAVRALNAQTQPVFERLRLTQDLNATLQAVDGLIHEEPIQQLYNDIFTTVGVRFARITFDALHEKSIKQEFSADIVHESSLSYVKIYGAEKVRGITQTSRDRIKREIQSVIDLGQDIEFSAARLAAGVDEINVARGRVISRTEIIAASNHGIAVGGQMSNLNLNKEWISSIDDRTRDGSTSQFDHIKPDGQIVHQSETFIVSGERLEFPGDSSHGASAGNLIQCRCTFAFIRIR